MIFMGATYQGYSPYFDDKLNKARSKLKEFPTIASIVDNFNLANRENHTENLFINLLSASVSDAFLDGKPNEMYNEMLKAFEKVLKELLPKLPRDKKNNLVVRLKSFGDKHRETINEIEFLVELKQNSNVSNVEYENERLGSHDFNIKIDGEEFNIEQTCLGKSKIQQIVEEAFNLASREIIERIPNKILLKIDVDTNKVLKERDNSVEEVKAILIKDYNNLENLILVDSNGSCVVDHNIGDHNKSLYDIKDLYDYYGEFGQRLKKLLENDCGITYLKNKKVGEIVVCSITHFMIFPAKFGNVVINSQSVWPSKAESLRKESLYGYDIDRTMVRIAVMNLMMHGITSPNIIGEDTLSKRYNEKGVYDLILANPPFKGSINESEKSDELTISTSKTELLFLELMYSCLSIGGRCAVIVPDGVLFGNSNAHKSIRKLLLEKCRLDAIISMPSGVFKPYAGVSTAVLFFTKGEPTEKVWFYDMEADGYTLDDKRNESKENDIPDILERFGKRHSQDNKDRSKKHFFVSLEEIKANDWDLSINKYRKEEHEEVVYRPSQEIIKETLELVDEIKKGLLGLKGTLP